MKKPQGFLSACLLAGVAILLLAGSSQADNYRYRANFRPRYYPANRMPGWDNYWINPYSPYNYGRNPYNPIRVPYVYYYPYYIPSFYPYYPSYPSIYGTGPVNNYGLGSGSLQGTIYGTTRSPRQ
jgi:hypothetical protein